MVHARVDELEARLDVLQLLAIVLQNALQRLPVLVDAHLVFDGCLFDATRRDHPYAQRRYDQGDAHGEGGQDDARHRRRATYRPRGAAGDAAGDSCRLQRVISLADVVRGPLQLGDVALQILAVGPHEEPVQRQGSLDPVDFLSQHPETGGENDALPN